MPYLNKYYYIGRLKYIKTCGNDQIVLGNGNNCMFMNISSI